MFVYSIICLIFLLKHVELKKKVKKAVSLRIKNKCEQKYNRYTCAIFTNELFEIKNGGFYLNIKVHFLIGLLYYYNFQMFIKYKMYL